MNKRHCSILLLFFSLASFGQKNTFGIIQYTVPSGYELIKHDNVLTYAKESKSTGAYCNFFIYKVMPGRGGIQEDFNYCWSNLLQQPFKVTGSAQTLPVANVKGWQFILGQTKFSDNGIATLAIQICFSGENNLQNICILSNSDSYKADIENFIASIDISREITQSASTTGATLPHPKYEVWMTPNLATTYASFQQSYKYVVLSADGDCLYYLPEQGLYNVTKANSNQTNSWGKITDKGDKLYLNNSQYGEMNLYKRTATSMAPYADSKPGSYYKRCQPVNGLKLEGAYSPNHEYYKKTNSYFTQTINSNKRPIIFFKKDGTYINEGIEFSNITKGDDYAIGKGTYELKDFTLILTTQSGRKLQVAFTGILDANPDGYIINNNLFFKLDNSFQPH